METKRLTCLENTLNFDKYITENLFVLSVRPQLIEGWFDRLTTNGETFV